MGFSAHTAWMPLWIRLLEAVEPSPVKMYFVSKLQSLKDNILTF